MSSTNQRRLSFALLWLFFACSLSADEFNVSKRSRTLHENGWVQIQAKSETWNPKETAIIVCDMWDAHHCLNAVRRGKQLAPRINDLVNLARKHGATIVHAPSSCLDFYKTHPARKNAVDVPKADNVPDDIEKWLNWRDANEEKIGYPIDASDGGEDDDLEEHKRWHAQLAAMGRNPGAPWIRQMAEIDIHDNDYITDDGVENWSILEHNKIKNVAIVGVHTNMCVLGRPFGLRQMANNKKNVVLVRDLTDTMYNPKMSPYVNHFSGTDLIIEHIEQHVCPTISSDQILGGERLRFRNDNRQHVVMLIGEQEYETQITLPKFARKHLYQDFRVSYVFADPHDINQFHGIEEVKNADVLFVSVRRRALPTADLQSLQNHVNDGKPVIGIRTASHAFSLRGEDPPQGHANWMEFDADVFGGNYTGHHGNKNEIDIKSFVWPTNEFSSHAIAAGIDWDANQEATTSSWLYKTSPLRPGTDVLMMGRVAERQPHEPVTWTNIHSGGGRAFYTSLGHPDDFENSDFEKMLKNAVYWSLGMTVPNGQSEIKAAKR